MDLDYNLPVQARDQALGLEDEALPESEVGREFALERMSNEGELGAAFGKARANEAILKLQRTTPYYKVALCFWMPPHTPLYSRAKLRLHAIFLPLEGDI